MKGIHVYLTIGFKGVKSTITVDIPTLPPTHLTVAEALVYANGLDQSDPVNVWLREQILKAVARIRADHGEE